MKIREALSADIKQIQSVRNSVRENTLSDPNLVTDKDCEEFINKRGKGWVCEIESQIVGFSIVDLKQNNIWALFVRPEFEKRGIGRLLHDTMLDWYFSKTNINVWLGTSPNTRGELFYKKSGWLKIGIHGKGKVKFEMTIDNWEKYKSRSASGKKLNKHFKLF